MGRLEGKTAVVTGGGRGIGKAICLAFAKEGAGVIVNDVIGDQRTLEVVQMIEKFGGKAVAVIGNVAVKEDAEKIIQSAIEHFGKVDVLVNNAGVTVFSSFAHTSLADFHRVFSTNMFGQIYCLKSVLPAMVKRNKGWVFNILSTASVHTFTNSSAYTAAKAGMLALMNVLREELRSANVKIVNVLPGPTATSMWSRGDLRKHSRKMMTPKDIGEAVLALYQFPPRAVPEEILLRPVGGDLS
jgi:3-oxoacyl-[acyl-carrier protein] reductase